MTEFENRKHARQPKGYVAVYGQNGITYKQAAYTPRKQSQPFNWTALVLAVVVIVIIGLVIAHFAGFLTLWEDGSFRLFSLVGCLPGGMCN
jgi:hypothetical protein